MKINSPIKNSLSLMSYKAGKSCAAALALSIAAFGANAAPLPYADTGTENTALYSFTATTTGDIVAYFVGKGGATLINKLSMSVNGVDTGVVGLNNQSSAYGDSLNLGFANAGDTVVFSIKVDFDKNWYSDKALNTDGANHVFSSVFSSEEELLPSGVYIGFEDLNSSTSDFNYLDEQFVVTNVSTNAVPVPAAAWLFGSGLLGLAGITRRRS